MNELNNENPSRLLLAAIQKNGTNDKRSFKDDDFYLGALWGDKVNIPFRFSNISTYFRVQLSQMYHITSGDPSRGTIALESHAAPPEGTVVQVLYAPFNLYFTFDFYLPFLFSYTAA